MFLRADKEVTYGLVVQVMGEIKSAGIDRLGINIDKIGAVIIIVFILSFSLETFVNFWLSLHGKPGWRDQIATGLIAASFDRRTWELLFQRISHLLNWDHLSIEFRLRAGRIFISLLALGVFLGIFLNFC